MIGEVDVGLGILGEGSLPPPQPLGGLREWYELSQWGPRLSPSHLWISGILHIFCFMKPPLTLNWQ